MSDAPSMLVLLSGSGRTLANLGAAIGDGRLRARVAGVVASRVCAGCDRARELGVEPRIVPGVIEAEALERLAQEAGAQWVVLAGYLKLVRVAPGLRGRIVNIHPALLPSFGGKGMYGHHVHEAVLAHGCRFSGCTVHLVDDQYDQGPILEQRVCPVLPGDTPDTLAARVFEQECIAYPQALSALFAGRYRIEGRVARVQE
jgi:phosphoribosylglycinamide formyltransferase-1